MKHSSLVFFFVLAALGAIGQLPTPQDFMPHTYGEEFTPHHRLVDYFYEIANKSSQVKVTEYGKTNQKRPLIYAIVTSDENHANLEKIRLNNLIRSGTEKGVLSDEWNKAIVWLSFGVHGNEAGASESSMMALYALVTGTLGANQDWLKNTVVIIDPCVNPDGYNRYTNWNINNSGQYKNPDPADGEHHEPWPSGRVNHYLHDLNRDWAWASQIETQQRLKVYHDWLPHIHSDFHEMYPESPYYFAPAAEPFHKYITDWQRIFQLNIGKNHAGYFDKNNWLYYTREEFDLFYPSYGDTYPMFNGAIGMTYEQAGHGVAGRAITIANGDTLMLQDRIDHHMTTALSTVEAASQNANEMISEFQKYFENAMSVPNGQYRSYVFKYDADAQALLKLLSKHHIVYGQAKSDGMATGFCFPEYTDSKFHYKKGDIVIPAKQPHGTMVQVLLDPKSHLTDSVTYDITAWSLLAAYGLQAVATTQEVGFTIASEVDFDVSSKPNSILSSYAYALPFTGMGTYKSLSKLVSQGIRCRLARKAFHNSGREFDKGTIIVTKADNIGIDLVKEFNEIPAKSDLVMLSTGLSEHGPDLGSDQMKLIKTPNILIVGGEGTDQYNYGQIWQMLDVELQLPYTTMLEQDFHKTILSDFQTIILPQGYYPTLNETVIQKMMQWVNDGGKLIVFGGAIHSISGDKGFAFNLKKEEEKEMEKVESGDHKLERYETAFRKSVSEWMPGAIVRLNMDDSHPLAYGLGPYYSTLKLSSTIIPYQDDTWNVGYIGDEVHYSGFIGSAAKEKLKNSNSFFVKDMGAGHVIGFVDNPLYRSFWHKGKQLFCNALFMVH
jgi:hypothetical protein